MSQPAVVGVDPSDDVTEDASRTTDVDAEAPVDATGDVDAKVDGYRDCSLHTLAACENTNQLFFGPLDTATSKTEIWDALDRFLKGAPTPYAETADAANAASDIGNALLGPGDPGERLAGEWFFWGFTPHATLEKAAAIFDAHGNILAAALLDDVPLYGSDVDTLYVYSHDPLRAYRLARFQTWARRMLSDSERQRWSPARFDATITIEFDSKRWITTSRP